MPSSYPPKTCSFWNRIEASFRCKKCVVLPVVFLIFLGTFGLSGVSRGEEEPFPVHPCIEPNLRFWTEIYSIYPMTKGVIHDSEYLQVVYTVIDLVAPDKRGATKINERRIKAAKNKYQKILGNLARNPATSDPEARRIAAMFGPKAARSKTFWRATKRIRCQVGQKDKFIAGVIRSGAFLDEIKEIFRSEGLPVDLVYLPHVESSYNPKAHSKSGAVGIWQFTRATGKRFLRVGYTMDERRDPILSSRAAAKLLAHNYGKLGDWPMAITAYNRGLSGMLRAQKAKGSYEAIFLYYRSRNFRFASRNFYSEFLAAREVAKNATDYLGPLEPERPIKTRTVRMKGYASPADLSRYFQVDISTLRELNPSFLSPIFKGHRLVPEGYELRLPAEAVDTLLASAGELPESLYQPRQKRGPIYRVKSGDTVSRIAHKHGVRTSDVIRANGLDSKGTIYVGQRLFIPSTGGKSASPKTSHQPKLVRVAATRPGPSESVGKTPGEKTPSNRAKIPVSELPVSPAAVGGDLEVERVTLSEDGQAQGLIRVEIEETLGNYAAWLKTPTSDLLRLNDLRSSGDLHLHQPFKIQLDRVTKNQFEQERLEFHRKIQEDFFKDYRVKDVEVYRVKNGDNIWTLSNERFKMPIWLIKKYNPNVDFKKLRWSQKLAIPVLEKIVADSSDIVAYEGSDYLAPE